MNKIIITLILIILLISGAIGYQLVVQKKNISTALNTSQPESGGQSNVNVAGSFKLEIAEPLNNSTTANEKITLKGKTSPSASVFVNDKETKADNNGDFSIPITLNEGENEIFVTANDDDGNYLEKQMTVILEAEN